MCVNFATKVCVCGVCVNFANKANRFIFHVEYKGVCVYVCVCVCVM